MSLSIKLSMKRSSNSFSSLRGLTHLEKSCQIYLNSMPKCLERAPDHFCDFPPKNIAYLLCNMLRFKVFGLVTSVALRFLFYRTGFTADDLRRTTSACYRLGYCYVLVNRVHKQASLHRSKSYAKG